jgi:hypothetical protein
MGKYDDRNTNNGKCYVPLNISIRWSISFAISFYGARKALNESKDGSKNGLQTTLSLDCACSLEESGTESRFYLQ